MSKTAIITIVIIILVVIGAIVWSMQAQPAQVPAAPLQTTTTTSTTTVVTVPITQTPSKTDSFVVNASDTSADVMSMSVTKGDVVSITFNVATNTHDLGGLDFRSSLINTGAIPPGTSKTITFTAASSFAFTPYWSTTNTSDSYKISVVVQ